MIDKPTIHAQDHWAAGEDPASTPWVSVGTSEYESPWAGSLRYRFDGNGDVELDGDVTGGTLPATIFHLPEAYWPSTDAHRPGMLSSGGTIVQVDIFAVDGEVSLRSVAVGSGGTSSFSGTIAATNVTVSPTGNISSTNAQSAFAELDSEKVPTTRNVNTTSPLAGGGALSSDRTLSLNYDNVTLGTSSGTLQVKTGSLSLGYLSDPELIAMGTLTYAADRFPYFTGATTASTATLTSFARSLLDDADAATMRTTLGITAGSESKLRTVWAKDMWPSGTAGSSAVGTATLATNFQTVKTIDFADGSDLKAEFAVDLPGDYDGETFTFKTYYTASGTSAGTATFGLQARAVGHGENIDGAWGTQVTTSGTYASGTAYFQVITDESPAITASNSAAVGDTLFCRLQRIASTDTLPQTAKVLRVALDFSGNGVSAMPDFISAGTAAETNVAPGDLALAYPASFAAGDLLLAQIVLRHGSDALDSTPAGWSLHVGPDAQSSTMQQWIYKKVSDGTETGTATWSSPNTLLFMGRMYAFRGVDSTVSESGGKSGANDASIVHTNVVTTGPNRLAVVFYTVSDDNTLAAMTGETGGDWDYPPGVADFLTTTGLDGAFGIQIADMPSATTLTGGGITMGATDPWLTRTMALLPVGG